MVERPKIQPTVGEKVLLHLSKYYQFRDEYVVPSAVTQKGISDAVNIELKNVPRTLKNLKEKDHVSERTCHIDGGERRYKVYFLTETGMFEAHRLKESLRRFRYIDFADKLPEIKYFYGREKELAIMSEWMRSDQSKILVISGIAGIGKTTIITKIISKHKHERNVFFYRLNEWTTLKNVATRLSDFLYQMDRRTLRSYLDSSNTVDLGDISHILTKELKESNTILVFDDQHKIMEGLQNFFCSLKELVESIDGVKIIVIGRHIIPFYDRRDVVVRKMVEEIQLEGLDIESSKELLTSKGIGHKEMDPIYRLTEGHPLFLELISTTRDLERESDIKKFIYEEIIIGLRDEERRLLEFMSVFRYPVPARALFTEPGMNYEIFGGLVDRSLLQVSNTVYDLHGIIKEFFYNRQEPESEKIYHTKAADHYLNEEGELACIEALYHLLKAENYKKCAELTVEHGSDLMSKGHIDELSGVLEHIPEKEVPSKLRVEILILKGDSCEITGRWEEALEYYQNSLNLTNQIKDKFKTVDIYQKMCKIYEGKGDYETALEYCNTALQSLTGDIESVEKARIYRNMGRVYWRKGEYDAAIEHIMKDLEIVEDIQNQKEIAEAYKNLGVVYWYKRNWGKAMEYCEKGLKMFENLGDVRGMASMYNNLGNVHADKGDWAGSEKYYKKGLEVFERIGDIHGIATTCGNLGVVCFDAGELDESIDYYKKSLKIREAIGDEQGMAVAYNNIGNIFCTKNDFTKAIEFYEKSLKIREKIGDAKGRITSYANLGTTYSEMGQLDDGLDYCKKSLELSIELGLKETEASAYRTYGIIYKKKGELERAKEYLHKSISLLEELDSPYNLGKSYCEYAQLHEEGNEKETRKYLKEALAIFEKLGAKRDIEDIEKILANLKQ